MMSDMFGNDYYALSGLIEPLFLRGGLYPPVGYYAPLGLRRILALIGRNILTLGVTLLRYNASLRL
jgi:hypothetical protein